MICSASLLRTIVPVELRRSFYDSFVAAPGYKYSTAKKNGAESGSWRHSSRLAFKARQETAGRPLALLSFTQLRSCTIPRYSPFDLIASQASLRTSVGRSLAKLSSIPMMRWCREWELNPHNLAINGF